ncbi:MAG TPA: YbaN family protein [Planctomycetota bacterium]|nr:YbaN family protein [Planctomycetota bacterium]
MRRILFLVGGYLSLALAVLGAFLPLLPTTPFLLLAAACFARSSAKLHAWLNGNPLFGPILEDWERYGAIRLRVKVVASVMMAGLVAYPVLFRDLPLVVELVAVGSVAGVLVFLWSRPSRPSSR